MAVNRSGHCVSVNPKKGVCSMLFILRRKMGSVLQEGDFSEAALPDLGDDVFQVIESVRLGQKQGIQVLCIG